MNSNTQWTVETDYEGWTKRNINRLYAYRHFKDCISRNISAVLFRGIEEIERYSNPSDES